MADGRRAASAGGPRSAACNTIVSEVRQIRPGSGESARCLPWPDQPHVLDRGSANSSLSTSARRPGSSSS
ncbi:hypothetical protein BJF90_23665 [Pseudonocardia sp. CNS-004]|nr:hypothetical protein BJF90_23665 [Pseudonocardia sp. CNS-004]